MIRLTPHHLIGKGRTRFCYRHPYDPDKCIKIDKRAIGGSTEKEARYYQKLGRIRPNLTYTHIPRFYGYVETSLGRGGVFDLIRDEITGYVSKSLGYYVRSGEVTADDPLWLEAHRIYMKTLYEEAVIIRDFNPGNICVRKLQDGSLRFITIDGIGHRFILTFSDHWMWFARSKLRRQVARKNFGSIEGVLARVAHKRKLFSLAADRRLE
jgi:hypothetical protein